MNRKPLTEAHKAALSRSQIGKPGYWTGKRRPPSTIEKMRAAKRGRHHTEATRQRIAEAGRRRTWSEATRAKIRERPISLETRMKIGLPQRGENSRTWKGGVSSPLVIERARARTWRKLVLQRDGHRCRWEGCGATESRGKLKGLHAHHILSFKEYPELRYDLTNGITYCRDHHDQAECEIRRLRRLLAA